MGSVMAMLLTIGRKRRRRGPSGRKTAAQRVSRQCQPWRGASKSTAASYAVSLQGIHSDLAARHKENVKTVDKALRTTRLRVSGKGWRGDRGSAPHRSAFAELLIDVWRGDRDLGWRPDSCRPYDPRVACQICADRSHFMAADVRVANVRENVETLTIRFEARGVDTYAEALFRSRLVVERCDRRRHIAGRRRLEQGVRAKTCGRQYDL